MPSSTVRYHSLHMQTNPHNTVMISPRARDAGEDAPAPGSRQTTLFLFPDEQFFTIIQELGFNHNDGTLNLMPLVYFER